MNSQKARRIAIQIPLSDREGREEKACLYGTEYYQLEDAITDMLVEETRPTRQMKR